MSLINWIDLPTRGDDRGSLVAIEAGESIPFDVKRVHYIFGTQAGISRSFHAHNGNFKPTCPVASDSL